MPGQATLVHEKHCAWFVEFENMFAMCRKVNAKEKIVGFYSTGPKIRSNDLAISALMKRFIPNPVFLIVDVRPECTDLPTQAYMAVDEIESDGKAIRQTFIHLPNDVGAFEAEEVGVEQLLRDINDPTVSSLSMQVQQKVKSLATLHSKLSEMASYLELVDKGEKPPNHEIMYKLQGVFNLLPNFNVEEMVQSLLSKSNDMHMVIYLSALLRSVMALHDLVSNKIMYKGSDGLFDEKKEAVEKGDGGKDVAGGKN